MYTQANKRWESSEFTFTLSLCQNTTAQPLWFFFCYRLDFIFFYYNSIAYNYYTILSINTLWLQNGPRKNSSTTAAITSTMKNKSSCKSPLLSESKNGMYVIHSVFLLARPYFDLDSWFKDMTIST